VQEIKLQRRQIVRFFYYW